MAQCRDLENHHHEKLLEISINTLEKILKGELDEDLPDDLRAVSTVGGARRPRVGRGQWAGSGASRRLSARPPPSVALVSLKASQSLSFLICKRDANPLCRTVARQTRARNKTPGGHSVGRSKEERMII